MKILIVFSVLALCAYYGEATPFLSGHFKGKASSSGGAEASVDSEVSAGSSSSSSSGGGLGNLLAIPIQIKSKIIQAKRNHINKFFDKIEGALSGFGGSSSAGSSAGSSANAGASAGSSGYANGGGEISGGFQGGEVQAYHPQPAPQAQYQQQPIVLHLYQVEIPQQHHQQEVHHQPEPQYVSQPEPQPQFIPQPVPAPAPSYQPAPVQSYQPAPVQSYQPAPVQSYQPAPVQSYQPAPVQSYQPAPVQPQNTYGPPSFQSAAPIQSFGSSSQANVEVQSQTMHEIAPLDNTYLPPHGNGNCQDGSHFH